MKFSVASTLTTLLFASAAYAAPASVEERNPVAVLGVVVNAYTGIATAIVEGINKDKKVCFAFPYVLKF